MAREKNGENHEMASKAARALGKRRWKNVPKEKRSQQMREAVKKRWAKKKKG